MFDTRIKISVVSAAGSGNEILLKPRDGKKLSFAGKSKQEALKRELRDSFDRYNSMLTERSWTILAYLLKHRTACTVQQLAKLIEPSVKDDDLFVSEFRYRLEWLVQLGLLDRTTNGYEISTVGDALIGIAQGQSSGSQIESAFDSAIHKLEDAVDNSAANGKPVHAVTKTKH